MRSALLAGSRSVWLRERATRYGFVQRAVKRFMPGEKLEDALAAAESLRQKRAASVLTYLGENVTTAAEADGVVVHYLGVLERVREKGLDAEISVKLTHMGLDLGVDVATATLNRVVERAAALKNRVWIDMEGTAYTDRTLEVFRRLRARHENVGVCLQSYLRRTPADLEALLPLGPSIRLVKGAYKEPPELAYPKKSDVDEAFLRLTERMLREDARKAGAFAVIGTHDPILVRRITDHAAAAGVPKDAFEFDLLFGIRTDEQERLVREGYRLRVLISYGSYWFPWYMRRLAERPANVMFVLRSVLSG
jgi:proline dehydrogenase